MESSASDSPELRTDRQRDDALILRMQGGDQSAFAELYDRHQRTAYVAAYRIVRDAALAEDVLQDAFLSAWRRSSSYISQRGTVQAWLFTIVRHAAIDRMRGSAGRTRNELDLDDLAFRLESNEEDVFTTVAGDIEAAQVRTAITLLPEQQRQAIDLAFFGGLTHQEIADRTGTPLGTVKSRLRLGLHKLQHLLGEQIDQVQPTSETTGSVHPENPLNGKV